MPQYTHPSTLFRILLLPAVIAFLYLYFYPAINDCAFPPARTLRTKCSPFSGECKTTTANAGKPPFRLLALADPQLEGDTSLPAGWNDGVLKRVWEDVASGDWDGLRRDLPVIARGYRKKLDLWGNDWYLAHVYAKTRWWAGPTHTVVLGDLLGSQWIGDGEFERRAERFWDKVLGGAERVPESVMDGGHEVEVLGWREAEWRRRVVAVAGNHDVGYAGDLNEGRIERFERAFGRVNWEIAFRLPNATFLKKGEFASDVKRVPDFFDGPGPQPEIRLVVLNSMNPDEPARSPALREQSLDFMENTICKPERFHNEHSATVLLTHIPLHKASGICVDGPFFSYFSPENGGGVREQNHLGETLSEKMIGCLQNTQSTIVLNGHDHEGCDTTHYTTPDDEFGVRKTVHQRDTASLTAAERAQAVREITVRSMMGSYGGYAGFLSGWFDREEGKWEFAYETCGFGVQHIWWVCNVVLLLEVGLGVMCALDVVALRLLGNERREKLKEA